MPHRLRTRDDLYDSVINYPGATESRREFETAEEYEDGRRSGGQTAGSRALKGVLSGAIAGVAATWVMTEYQTNAKKILSRIRAGGQQPDERRQEQDAGSAESTPPGSGNPTISLANRISRSLRDREVSPQHQQLAGTLVHYGFGTVNGMLFGILSEILPAPKPIRGLAYGAFLWGAADELLLPSLGLAGWWSQYPTTVHMNALGAHLVYGTTLDVCHFGVRHLLEREGHVWPRRERAEFRAPRVHPRPSERTSPSARRYSIFELGKRLQSEREPEHKGKRAA